MSTSNDDTRLEPSSFAVDVEHFKLANKWFNNKTVAQRKALIKQHKLVTFEHLITLWKKEGKPV